MLLPKQNAHKGERCFVIASGPSVKGMDLSWLKDETVICVNQSYKAIDFEPDYICIGDKGLWPKIKNTYAKMKSKIVCGTGLDGTVGSDYTGKNLHAVMELNKTKHCNKDEFSWKLTEGVSIGWNVIPEVVLPFVCWSGFSECYLIGCDCSGSGYFYKEGIQMERQAFDPRAMDSYRFIAKRKDTPTKIYNSTIGGNLDCFPRKDLSCVKPLLVIGFYTPNQDYEKLANKMKQSVERQGMKCEIYERPSAAREGMTKPMPWVLNCAQCGPFIWDMRQKYPGLDLLYLDADAVMVRRPELFLDCPRDYDFATVFLTNKYTTNQLSSNVLYFAANERADALLKAWCDEQAKRNDATICKELNPPYKEAWDQKVLQDVLPLIPDLSWVELPYEYGKLTVTPKGEELMPTVDPKKIVIEQYQASRWNKWEV